MTKSYNWCLLLCAMLVASPVMALDPQEMEPECHSTLTHSECTDTYSTFCNGEVIPVCHTAVDLCNPHRRCIKFQVGSGCSHYAPEIHLSQCRSDLPLLDLGACMPSIAPSFPLFDPIHPNLPSFEQLLRYLQPELISPEQSERIRKWLEDCADFLDLLAGRSNRPFSGLQQPQPIE